MKLTPFPKKPEDSHYAHHHRFPLLLSVCMLISTAASSLAQAQWSTVDDVANGSASGIVSDSAGNIYIAGTISNTQAVVTKSSDKGENWSTIYYGAAQPS